MLDFINHSSRKEPNLNPHAGFAEKHSQVLLTSHTWASESAANLASHDSLHYSHIQTAYTSQPIYTEPFMNAFFPFSPCIVGVSLYWRWETHFLHWSAFMFSTWEYNKKKKEKTPQRTISPQHYVCEIHVPTAFTKTISGEQDFSSLLGCKILCSYMI